MSEWTEPESMQASVAEWEQELARWRARIGEYTGRVTTRNRVFEYMAQLLAPAERHNIWQMAEAAGQNRPYAFQHVLGRARWSADGLRNEVREQAWHTLHETHDDDVLVIDETGFLKQGNRSAGVKRQYSGTAGRVENCQVGVFLTYAGSRGHALVDRELYLPAEWCNDPARCQDAGIPEEVTFQTKPQLAQTMLTRAFEAGLTPCWVTGDAVYGGNRHLRLFLEGCKQGYVMAVSGQEAVWMGAQQYRVKTLIEQQTATPEAWYRLSAGAGSKGQRVYDWAVLPLNTPLAEGWTRQLLLRRSVADSDDITAYVAFAPQGTSLETLIKVAGKRWTVERCFVEAKDQLGLDEYEVRSWTGWYRHITLVMIAHIFLTTLCVAEQQKEPPSDPPNQTGIDLTLQEIRRLLTQLGCFFRIVTDVIRVIARSQWRRGHQAYAKRCHYRRNAQRYALGNIQL
jgi:SRSO17 transposase